MQNAVKKPGALRKQLGVKKGKKIPEKRLQSIKSRLHKKASKGKLTPAQRKLDERVNLAMVFKRNK